MAVLDLISHVHLPYDKNIQGAPVNRVIWQQPSSIFAVSGEGK